MAFNFQTFRTRALTAIVFVLVMLTGLLWNPWSFLVLFSVIHFGCWIEYQKLVGLIDEDYQQINPSHQYGIMLAGWGYLLWMTDNNYVLGTISLSTIGWWIFAVSFISFIVGDFLHRLIISAVCVNGLSFRALKRDYSSFCHHKLIVNLYI